LSFSSKFLPFSLGTPFFVGEKHLLFRKINALPFLLQFEWDSFCRTFSFFWSLVSVWSILCRCSLPIAFLSFLASFLFDAPYFQIIFVTRPSLVIFLSLVQCIKFFFPPRGVVGILSFSSRDPLPKAQQPSFHFFFFSSLISPRTGATGGRDRSPPPVPLRVLHRHPRRSAPSSLAPLSSCPPALLGKVH